MLKRFYSINFIDAFIAGVTTVIVPLLMLSRGIDITTIGIVFAAAPLAKAFVRVAAAAVADSFGDRIIYASASMADFLLSLVYLVSTTATGFAAGKILDGSRESLIWSVNRASLMAAVPEKKHFALINMQSVRYVYNALGSLAVGVLFAYGGFSLPLVLIVVLSAYLVFSSLRLKNFHRSETHVRLSDLSPFGRSSKFYEMAGLLALGSILYSVSFYMLLPIYFSQQGFSLAEIGLFYAGYFLLQGTVMYAISHKKAKTGQMAVAGASIYCAGLAGVAFAPHLYIPAFFLLMALGDACLSFLWEQANYVAAKGSKKPATDLALLTVPCLLGIMAASSLSGAGVAAFGFLPFFALLAICEIAFCAWCVRLPSMEG